MCARVAVEAQGIAQNLVRQVFSTAFSCYCDLCSKLYLLKWPSSPILEEEVVRRLHS